MEAKKHFSDLFNLVRNSPVGFLRLDFKSNMNPEELDSWDSDQTLELNLYKGEEFFGSFVFSNDDVPDMNSEEFDELGPIYILTGMEEKRPSKNRLWIRLDFLFTECNFGECCISEYEEESEETTENQVKETISYEKVILPLSEFEMENIKRARKRRITINIVIVVVTLTAGYFFIKEHPEMIKHVWEFFENI
jgi:hypothetical protein